jgi:hypothetical protein
MEQQQKHQHGSSPQGAEAPPETHDVDGSCQDLVYHAQRSLTHAYAGPACPILGGMASDREGKALFPTSGISMIQAHPISGPSMKMRTHKQRRPYAYKVHAKRRAATPAGVHPPNFHAIPGTHPPYSLRTYCLWPETASPPLKHLNQPFSSPPSAPEPGQCEHPQPTAPAPQYKALAAHLPAQKPFHPSHCEPPPHDAPHPSPGGFDRGAKGGSP